MCPQVLRARAADTADERGAAGLVVALDEAQVRGVLPDRKARARRSPRLERLGVRAFAGADPFEEVQDQVVDGLWGIGRRRDYATTSSRRPRRTTAGS